MSGGGGLCGLLFLFFGRWMLCVLCLGVLVRLISLGALNIGANRVKESERKSAFLLLWRWRLCGWPAAPSTLK